MRHNTADTDSSAESRFKRRIWIVTWVTLVLPPLTGIVMLSFVGVFPFPEVFYPFIDYTAVLVLFSVLTGFQLTKVFIRRTMKIAEAPHISEQEQKQLKNLPLYYFSLLFVYFAAGLVITLYSLSTLHGFNYPPGKYLVGFFGIIPGGLITALPIFFYLTDTLGRYLAPHGAYISVAPIKLKLIVLGLFTPALIDTLLIMYFYDRTGYLTTEVIGIWFFLIVIAAGGTVMAWQSFRQSLSPFVSALDSGWNDHTHINIVPQSLDELGLLSHRWHNLWTRVLQYEKYIADYSLSLEGDVRQRTHELESEKLFINKVLKKTSAFVVVLDNQGHIIRINPAVEKATGFSFNELRNQPIWERLIPSEQIDDVKQVFNNLTEAGLDSQYENDLMKRDGGRIMVAWNNTTIRDAAGTVQYIVSIGTDISERQAAQQALQEATYVAEQASQAKSEFLSRMSHELRTPLNAILGFGQILQMNNDNLTTDQKEFIEEVLKGGHHLLTLVNEILDLAKAESGKLDVTIEDVNASQIIAESISLLKPQAQQRQITIHNNIPENIDYIVRADHLRLKQVFINLLSNAIKFNIYNGDIYIEISQPVENTTRISVRDTGRGIPPDKLDKLFTPFERLNNTINNAVEGAGIGLALSKRMMESMNGNIGVESRPPQGSTFYFDLLSVRRTEHERLETTRMAKPGT